MKPVSKIKLFPFLLFLGLVPVGGAWAGDATLFTEVPSGDRTFSHLKVLADSGLLDEKDAEPPLTRFEVARLILDARHELEARARRVEIILAQATSPEPGSDDLLQPLTEELGGSTSSPVTETPESLVEAWKNLNSLEEAYQYELKAIRDKAEGLKAGIQQAESDQYDLWKSLKGVTWNPSVSIHGRGLGRVYDEKFSFLLPGFPIAEATILTGVGFLDLEPTGIVSKEIRWKAVVRLIGSLLPDNNTNGFAVRRIELEFNPPWFSLDLGDFYEAYTPLTLWSRSDMDLKAPPAMMAWWDNFRKYESYFQNTPQWPLRGARIGTDLMWPEGGLFERWQASLFAHMIRNGYNTATNGYFGPGSFTDWIFGGRTEISLKKGFFTGGPDIFSLEASGVMLDQALGTNRPGSVYIPLNPGTWAHRYVLGSLRPKLEAGFGGGLALGGQFEMSGAYYHDDKRDGTRTINDWAQLGGPYLKLDDSILAFNFLNVGPYYYAPTAQIRQENPMFFALTPEQLFPHVLKGPAFITSVSRPGTLFDFYDRTQDNIFPYGLATPNREGYGLDLDVKALEKKALRLSGSFYMVHEISGNLVVNPGGTGFDPVDAPPGPPPVRDFTYFNTGAAFNMGPLIGLPTDLEWTANVRMESTESSIGKLDSLWILGGLRAGLFPWLEFSVALGQQSVKGREAGILGTTYARYPFLFDNTDLGDYSVIQLDGTLQSLLVSFKVEVSKNSRFHLDYSLNQGDLSPLTGVLPIQVVKHHGELNYEVDF